MTVRCFGTKAKARSGKGGNVEERCRWSLIRHRKTPSHRRTDLGTPRAHLRDSVGQGNIAVQETPSLEGWDLVEHMVLRRWCCSGRAQSTLPFHQPSAEQMPTNARQPKRGRRHHSTRI